MRFGWHRPSIGNAVARRSRHRPGLPNSSVTPSRRAARRTGGNPAKRTFQALRIEVNGELDTVRTAIPAAVGTLLVGGRIVVLAYHSLEDRIVKQALAALATDTTPPGLPVSTRRAGSAAAAAGPWRRCAAPTEIAANPRSASVRLRAAERIRMPA